MDRELSILQANLNKQREAQVALHNDDDTRCSTAILGQEPHCFLSDSKVVLPGGSLQWTSFVPTTVREGPHPVRSCIWVNKDVKAVQVPVASADVTVVTVQLGERKLLLGSVYIPTLGQYRGKERQKELEEKDLKDRLALLEGAVEEARRIQPRTEVLITGDFNRHDFSWSGDHMVHSGRQGEAQAILDWAERLDLQQMLPRGTITWEADGRAASTIDLVFATERLYEERMQCQLWEAEYGSDHRVVHASFDVRYAEIEPEPKTLFKHAQWHKIREMVSSEKNSSRPPEEDADAIAEWLGAMASRAVSRYTPKAKPSKYAKRWWTAELNTLRKSYTHLRNKARSLRRQGWRDVEVEEDAKQAKRVFHHTIRQQKKQHWEDFLDDTANVWTAAKYIDPQPLSSFARVSTLRSPQGTTVHEDEQIADVLLEEFFPPAPEPAIPEEDPGLSPPQLPFEPLTMTEIQAAIFKASPNKAPGPDGLPMLVWRELWPVLGEEIASLFNLSVAAGKVPSSWKTAKIVPLKKPGKDDYTVARSFRPISLLCTLGKHSRRL